MKGNIIKGSTIINRRKSLGLTQEQLADKIEVTPQTISNWENEVTSIKDEHIRELSKALELTEHQLINGTYDDERKEKNLLEEAISYAVECHVGQQQKGSNKPYILHPLEVLQILLEMEVDDNLLMAGVLHEVVEESQATLDDIERRFGEDVRKLVASHTENKELSWEERKEHAIEELFKGDLRIKTLILADCLSNLRRMSRDYIQVGESLWDRFKKGKEQQAWYYGEMGRHFIDLEDADEEIKIAIKELEGLYKNVFSRKLSNKIRALYKAPGKPAKEIIVDGIPEINKLLGNLDENGNGTTWDGSDICKDLGCNMELYMNDHAQINSDLPFNIYGSPSEHGMIFGAVVIAGYDLTDRKTWIASLTDEQMEKAKKYLIMCE